MTKTKLTLKFEFNKPFPAKGKKQVKDFIEKLSKKFKGLKTKETIGKNSLTINVETTQGYPTHFIVQLDRKIKSFIGKEFKVGTKDYVVSDYKIEAKIEGVPKEMKIPFVDKLEVNKSKVKILYKKLNRNFIEEHRVERTFKLIEDKIKKLNYEGKDEFKQFVWEGKKRKIIYEGDPAVDLEKKGWIKRTGAKGQFILGREVTALINSFKELMVEKIYEPLGFYEMIFPKFEPWSIPKKSGHAKNVYPNAYFVMVPKDSSEENWEDVMDEYAITHEVDTEKIKEKSVNVGILSFAQCPPFWPFLEKRTIDNKTMPLKIYDWSGPTYRNESGGTHGLDRVEEFHRTETLWVGEEKDVAKIWKDVSELFRKFFDEVLDLEIKMYKVSPWWMAHEGKSHTEGTEDVGTFDFDAFLPYRGRDKEGLEIQNASANGDKYPKAFQVKLRKGELYSGCAGGSFERWLVAFLAQKGLDPKKWPTEIKKRYLKKVGNFNELKFLNQ